MSRGLIDRFCRHIANALTPTKHTITPSKGSSYASWGGCFYIKIGRVIIVHMGLSGLTANTYNDVYTMPVGLRPEVTMMGFGGGASGSQYASGSVAPNGIVNIWTPTQYGNLTVIYTI